MSRFWKIKRNLLLKQSLALIVAGALLCSAILPPFAEAKSFERFQLRNLSRYQPKDPQNLFGKIRSGFETLNRTGNELDRTIIQVDSTLHPEQKNPSKNFFTLSSKWLTWVAWPLTATVVALLSLRDGSFWVTHLWDSFKYPDILWQRATLSGEMGQWLDMDWGQIPLLAAAINFRNIFRREFETLEKFTKDTPQVSEQFKTFLIELDEIEWVKEHIREMNLLVIASKENVKLLFQWLLYIKNEFGMEWLSGHWKGIQKKFGSKEKILAFQFLIELLGPLAVKTYWDEIFESYQEQIKADKLTHLSSPQGLVKIYGEDWIDGHWLELKPRLDFYIKNSNDAYRTTLLPYLLDEKFLAPLKKKNVHLGRFLLTVELLIRGNRYTESEAILLMDDLHGALLNGTIPSYITQREINDLLVFTAKYRFIPLQLYDRFERTFYDDRKTLETEWEHALEEIKSGKFDIKDPLHVDLGYVLLQEKYEKNPVPIDPINYETYLQLIEKAKINPQETIAAQLSQEEKDEVRYLAYEGTKFLEFILKVNEQAKKQNRPVLVIENMSYGKVALSPIRLVLDKLEIKVIESTVYSGECFSAHDFLNPNLFSEDVLQYIIQERPVIIVADASINIGEKIAIDSFYHYPNAVKGYRNYFIALNKALGFEANAIESYISKETLTKLRAKDSFLELKEKIQNLVSSIIEMKPYQIGYWTDSKLGLVIEENELNHLERAPPILNPNQIQGPVLILTQSAIEHSSIEKDHELGDLKAAAVLSQTSKEHKPAYFDDKNHFKRFYMIATPQGPNLIQSPAILAQTYFEQLDSLSHVFTSEEPNLIRKEGPVTKDERDNLSDRILEARTIGWSNNDIGAETKRKYGTAYISRILHKSAIPSREAYDDFTNALDILAQKIPTKKSKRGIKIKEELVNPEDKTKSIKMLKTLGDWELSDRDIAKAIEVSSPAIRRYREGIVPMTQISFAELELFYEQALQKTPNLKPRRGRPKGKLANPSTFMDQLIKTQKQFFKNSEKFRQKKHDRIFPSFLPRIIEYMSQDRIACLPLEQPSEDQLDLIGRKFFEMGGSLETVTDSKDISFGMLYSVLVERAAHLFPNMQIIQDKKEEAQELWDKGRTRANVLKTLPPKEMSAILKKPLDQKNEPPLVNLFDVTEISEKQIKMIATLIQFAFYSERKVYIPLLTNRDTLDPQEIEKLKNRLIKDFNVTPKMLRKISFGKYTITSAELLASPKQAGIDPKIEMDPDAIYEFLEKKIGGGIHVQIFSDNLYRFKQDWKTKNLDLLLIVSATQVLHFSQELLDSLKAQEHLSRNQ